MIAREIQQTAFVYCSCIHRYSDFFKVFLWLLWLGSEYHKELFVNDALELWVILLFSAKLSYKNIKLGKRNAKAKNEY